MKRGLRINVRRILAMAGMVVVLGALLVAILWGRFVRDFQGHAHRKVDEALKAVFGEYVEFNEQPSLGGLQAEREQVIVVENLVVRPDANSSAFIHSPEVVIYFDPWPVFKMETPAVNRVVFRRPQIHISRDDKGELNLTRLWESIKSYRKNRPAKKRGARKPPIINIEDAKLVLQDESFMTEPIVLEQMELQATTELITPLGDEDADPEYRFRVSGRSRGMEGRWGFQTALSMSEGNPDVEAEIKGTFIPVSDEGGNGLQAGMGALWAALEPRGTLREISIRAHTSESGEWRIETDLDASELEFGLLEETIGAEVRNLDAVIAIGQRGTTLEASAESVHAEGGHEQFFRLSGAFGGASDVVGYDTLELELSHLNIDSRLRDSLARLAQIESRITGQDRGALDAELGDKLVARLFDPYDPSGILDLQALYSIPRSPGLRSRVQGTIDIREAKLEVPIAAGPNREAEDIEINDILGQIRFDGDDLTIPEPLIGKLGDARIELTGSVQSALEHPNNNWAANLRIQDLAIDRDLIDRVTSAPHEDDEESPGWLGVIAEYDVQGETDLTVGLRGRGSEIYYRRISLTPDGKMSFSFPPFPYRLRQVDGALSIEGDDISIDIAGIGPEVSPTELPAAITIRGHLERFGDPERETIDVRVRAYDLPLNETLYEALGQQQPALRDLLIEELQATGAADLGLRYTQTAALEPELNLELRLQDCWFRWGGDAGDFRYPLHHTGGGRVRYLRGDVVLDEIEAQSPDGEEFLITGRVDQPGTDEQVLNLRIKSDRLSFSDNLKRLLGTLHNDYIALWDDFAPTGAVSVDYELVHGPGEASSNTIEVIPVVACTARAAHFPMTVRGIKSGRVLVLDDEIRIEGLTANDGNTSIVIDGRIDQIADDTPGPAVNLDVTARNLAFDEELEQALPESVREVWREFDPQGAAHVRVNLSRKATDAAEEMDLTVDVDLAGCRARYEGFPAPLAGIHGHVTYANLRDHTGERQHRVDLEGLRASLLGGELEVASATILGFGDARRANLHVLGRRIDLAHPHLDDIRRQLEASPEADSTVRQVVTQLRDTLDLKGRTDLDLLLTLEGFDLRDLSVVGTLTSDRLTLKDVELVSLDTEVQLHNRILTVPELRGSLYGGTVAGNLSLDTSAFGAFDGQLELRGVDAGDFVRRVFAVDSDRLSGRLSSSLRFSGLGPDPDSIVGRGNVEITDGWLWEMPFFLQILDSTTPNDTSLADRGAFQACQAAFGISDGMVRFDHIHIDANSLRIQGKGDMDFDGALDMLVLASATPKHKIPIVADLLSGVASGLIGFGVSGTYREPKLSVKPAMILTEIIAEIAESAGADIAPEK